MGSTGTSDGPCTGVVPSWGNGYLHAVYGGVLSAKLSSIDGSHPSTPGIERGKYRYRDGPCPAVGNGYLHAVYGGVLIREALKSIDGSHPPPPRNLIVGRYRYRDVVPRPQLSPRVPEIDPAEDGGRGEMGPNKAWFLVNSGAQERGTVGQAEPAFARAKSDSRRSQSFNIFTAPFGPDRPGNHS